MDVSFVDYSGLRTRLGNDPAAPSEPQPLIGSKGLSQCNGQAAGCSFVGRIGNRYTVRNNDEARQRNAPTWCVVKRSTGAAAEEQAPMTVSRMMSKR